MSTLDGLRVVLAGDPTPWVDDLAEALRSEGAVVDRRGAQRDLLLGIAERPDLVLVALGDAAEVARLRGAARAGNDPDLPVAVVLPSGADVADARAGLLTLPATPTETLVEGVHALGAARRRARGLEEHLFELGAAARSTTQALGTLRRALDQLEHDLRTPLGVAMGFAANLRDGIDGPLTTEQKEHAALIVQALRGAQSVLEETHGVILQAAQLARPSQGDAPVTRRAQRTQVTLSILAAEIVDLLRDTAGSRGVQLSAACAPGVAVWGSAASLRQLLTNLVANAVKFTPAGGHVTVHVDWQAGGADQRRMAQVVVADTGPGIPAADHDRVFESGVRLERDAAVPGQGIGLSVCRDVAAQHGGSIRIDETAGGGATFAVTLPQDRRARAAPGVVVVRDEQEAASIVEAILAEQPGDLTVTTRSEAPSAIVVVPQRGAADALDAAVARIRQRQEQGT